MNGKKHGKGKFLLKNNTYYEGEFKVDMLNGYVRLIFK